MGEQTKPFYEFGTFRIDCGEHLLWRGGEPVPLPPKVFDTLVILVENSGHVLGKDELMKAVWPDSFVEEVNLAHNISILRKVLSQGAPEQSYIQTVPRRGYRFTAEVRQIGGDRPDLLVEESYGTRILIKEEEETSEAAGTEVSAESNHQESAKKRLVQQTLIVCMLLGLALVAFYILRTKETKQSAGATIKSIAVLPFKPLDGSGRDEPFELGMADTLITKLSNLQQLIVRPTSAVRNYMSLGQDAMAAGRELKVDLVLEGNIQRSGEKIRITVRLIDVKQESPVWTYKCDELCTDIFALQDSMSEEVAQALTLKLTGEESRRLAKRYTENSEAYQLYVKGRHFFNRRDEEGLRKAIEYFNQATIIDPAYALAYAGLADSYNMLYVYTSTVDDPEGFGEKTKAAALKALELDETLAEAHASFGKFKENFLADYPGAMEEYKIALQLNPSFALARFWYSRSLAATGHLDEALAEAKRTRGIDPLTMINNINVGQLLCYAHRYDEAIDELNGAVNLDPKHPGPYRFLAEVYAAKGMFEAAIENYEKSVKFSRGPGTMGLLSYIYALWGKKGEAEKVLAEMGRVSRREYMSPVGWVVTYAALGQKDKAFDWLQRAVIAEDSGTYFMKVDPKLDSLRSDPRFARLLQRKRLPE